MNAGDRITDTRSHKQRSGTVTRVGRCDWGRNCPHGDDCVTVLFDGGFTTENRHARDLGGEVAG